MEPTIKTDLEIFEGRTVYNDLRRKVHVMHLNKKQTATYFHTNIYLKSSLFILVLNGSVRVEINFKEWRVNKDAIALLSFGHFFKLKQISKDFSCVLLYVGKDYTDEMYSTDMIYKRVKYGVKMHSTPVLNLNQENAKLLERRLVFTEETIELSEHRYYKEMILHSLRIFFLDLSNIIESADASTNDQQLSRDELYFQKFLDLLVGYYKEEHQVGFYARQLHITSHYLTLIVKRLSGQTVADFIFQLVYSEAKILLQQPDLSIQQIAETLHFSDQSSFGKFFKRNNGSSPKEFRKEILN